MLTYLIMPGSRWLSQELVATVGTCHPNAPQTDSFENSLRYATKKIFFYRLISAGFLVSLASVLTIVGFERIENFQHVDVLFTPSN